jgi:hypothetical protein
MFDALCIADLEGYQEGKRRQRIRSVSDRFSESFIPEPMSGCHLWVGAENGNGYGTMSIRNTKYFAHRVAWAIAYGSAPRDLLILHKCDNRACVNVSHLYAGDYRDNGRDCVERGGNPLTRRTHCQSGHPLDGENLAVKRQSNGRARRVCLECMRGYRLRWYHANKGNK